MQNLIINEELKNLLPPLSAEEFSILEKNILKDGCLSPLVEWNGILIDGHHRYDICTRHQIPFSVKSVVLESLEDAKLWAWQHQEGQRNLTPFHRAELALRFKDVIAAKARERQIRKPADSVPPTLAEQKETRQELAQIAGISHGNLSKVEYITERADEETKEKLRRGDKGTSINKEYNRLRAEEKAASDDGDPDKTSDFYPPLSQPIPEKDSQFVQTVKLQNIPLNDPERLIACLFDLFDVRYREQLVLDLVAKMETDDGKKAVNRIMSKLNKKHSN
ncbi:MAG TPA: hypothetical protein DEB39_13305 [Planctomycetaceae bacterium]|nr:hypothetical protein [Planctomycetaceae bacterium]